MSEFNIQQFHEEFYAAADTIVPEKWYDFFTDDIEASFKDTHYHGKEDLVKNFPVFGFLASMKHTTRNLWYKDQKFASEVDVVYQLKGDPELLQVHARAMVTGLVDEEKRKLKQYRVYWVNQAFLDRLAYVMSLNKAQ